MQECQWASHTSLVCLSMIAILAFTMLPMYKAGCSLDPCSLTTSAAKSTSLVLAGRMACIECQSCLALASCAVTWCSPLLRASLKKPFFAEGLGNWRRWCAGSPSAATASSRARSSAMTATPMGVMGAHLSARCFPALCFLHAFMLY